MVVGLMFRLEAVSQLVPRFELVALGILVARLLVGLVLLVRELS